MSYQYFSERSEKVYQHFSIVPAAGALGGVVSGLDLNTQLTESAFDELYQAFLEYKVLFFKQQAMTPEQHIALARRFGLPQGPGSVPSLPEFPQVKEQVMDEDTNIGSDVNYHADDTFRTYPSKLSILRGLKMPAGGGNTIWTDMEKSFKALSEPMQVFLEGLSCIHNLDKTFGRAILEAGGGEAWDRFMKENPPVTHPLIVTHAETGRKSIYASQLTGVRIPELSEEESDTLLAMILKHSYQPEFQCRFTWEDDSIAIWDNRCTQHRGIADFFPAYRHMHRIAVVDTLRPSTNPSEQEPLQFDPELDYVKIHELGEYKPHLDEEVVNESKPADDNAEVDPQFWQKLNDKKADYTFTSGAAAQVKKIPMMFRSPALRAIFKMAEFKGVSEINVALLKEVNESRKN